MPVDRNYLPRIWAINDRPIQSILFKI